MKQAMNYKQYEKIFVGDFKIKSSIESFDPESKLYDFFTKEFSQVINKKIEKLELKKNNNETPLSLKETLKYYPNSLLITGKLNIDIKTRSIVKSVKNASGAKDKAFVKVHLWNMNLTVSMIDSSSGDIASKNTFEEKLKDADPKKLDYSFKLMFDNITDRLIRKSTRKIRSQKRYLLLE
jgi:hypothetical protein